MPRRRRPQRKASESPPKLKQQTLFGFVSHTGSSSPVRSSPSRKGQAISTPSRAAARQTVRDIESDEEQGGGSSSDVDAIRFVPEPFDPCVSSEDESPRRPESSKRKRIIRYESSHSQSDQASDVERDDLEANPVAKRKGRGREEKRGKRRPGATSNTKEDEPLKKRRLAKGVSLTEKGKMREEEKRSRMPAGDTSTAEEDEPPKKRRLAKGVVLSETGKKRDKKKTRRRPVGDTNTVEEEEKEEPPRKRVVKGVNLTGKGKEKEKTKGERMIVSVSSSGEEEEAGPPRKRKLVKGIRPPSPETEDEDLLDELDEDKIIGERLRTRNKKSAFLKNLEKLKGKKRGQVIAESSESESGSEVELFEGAKPSTQFGQQDEESNESEDENDPVEDSFIIEDDNTSAPTLPVEFRMDTYQDLTHQFKIICQFFVHLTVQPPDKRHAFMEKMLKDEEYFAVPLQIARRKLIGMRDSLVASSVWRPDFKGSLEKYPKFEPIRMDFTVPDCDACHLGGRLSTFMGRLGGIPYDRLGFEPKSEVSDESSSDDSDEDSDNDSDGGDEDKWTATKEFHLGRFCAKRTEVFHQFTHWEYSLYQSLLREVEELRLTDGRRGFTRVAFAGGKKPPTDLSDADGIMDWLDQRGLINAEWQTIKDMMERARHLEMASKRGEDAD